jgi:hypothetical protein
VKRFLSFSVNGDHRRDCFGYFSHGIMLVAIAIDRQAASLADHSGFHSRSVQPLGDFRL